MTPGTRRLLCLGTALSAASSLPAGVAVLRLPADDAAALREAVREAAPDAVVAGHEDVAAVVLALAHDRGIPPPVLAVAEPAAVPTALAAGAVDVLRPDVTAEEVLARLDLLAALGQARQDLARQAAVDAVTGALTRRVFLTRAAEEVERARRYGQHLSLMVVDIDALKAVNRRHGTDVGDEVLRMLAATCVEVLRESDLLGRLGADALAVLLPSTTGAGALALAERLRLAVREAPIAVGGKAGPVHVTVCIGAAEAGHDAVEVLLGRAEKALAAAQSQGPDHVVLAIGGA